MADTQVRIPLTRLSAATWDSSLRGPGVLVLMDDPGLQNATRLLLETERYRVLTAAVLPQALGMARREPDIDILLASDPLCDGVTAIEALLSLRLTVGPALKALVLGGETSPSWGALRRDRLARIATMPIAADALLAALRSLRESAPSRRSLRS